MPQRKSLQTAPPNYLVPTPGSAPPSPPPNPTSMRLPILLLLPLHQPTARLHKSGHTYTWAAHGPNLGHTWATPNSTPTSRPRLGQGVFLHSYPLLHAYLEAPPARVHAVVKASYSTPTSRPHLTGPCRGQGFLLHAYLKAPPVVKASSDTPTPYSTPTSRPHLLGAMPW